ncbi:MAG: META domain-containing protein [Candidatus Marinimicrobia bacterium]|nr:META domain-containing protein [Candidatus Neomarinimicrobiota bacterium]
MKKFTAIIPLILLSLAGTGCADEEWGLDEALLDVVWITDSLVTPEATFVTATGGGYGNIWFGSDMQVSGFAGGDRDHKGSYEITGRNTLDISLSEPTGYSCSGPSFTCLFPDALNTVTSYVVTGSSLRLSDDNGNIIYFHNGLIEEALLDHVWKMDLLQSPEMVVIPTSDTQLMVIQQGDTTYVKTSNYSPIFTIEFRRELITGGQLLCNTYFGVYEINEMGKIIFFGFGSSSSGCGPIGGPLEQHYSDVMKGEKLYTITGSQLKFSSSDGAYLITFSSD